MVYLYNWILYNNENEWTSTTFDSVNEFHKLNVEQNKPDTIKYILYDSVYIKFKTQNESVVIDVRVVVWEKRVGQK